VGDDGEGGVGDAVDGEDWVGDAVEALGGSESVGEDAVGDDALSSPVGQCVCVWVCVEYQKRPFPF
jgi:hypothetical protein